MSNANFDEKVFDFLTRYVCDEETAKVIIEQYNNPYGLYGWITQEELENDYAEDLQKDFISIVIQDIAFGDMVLIVEV